MCWNLLGQLSGNYFMLKPPEAPQILRRLMYFKPSSSVAHINA